MNRAERDKGGLGYRGTGEDFDRTGVGRLYAGGDFMSDGDGDHGGIVARELFRREVNVEVFKGFFGGFSEGLVCGDTTGKNDRGCVGINFKGFFKLFYENFNGSFFEGGGEIGNLFGGEEIF